MSSATLEPRFAATLAQDAYRLKDDITRRIVLSEYKDKLEVKEELSGKTGALIVSKSSHVMGIGAFGVGDHEGEACTAGSISVCLGPPDSVAIWSTTILLSGAYA